MTPRVDEPTAGTYRRRIVKGGAWCAVKIWYGQPADPDTGELLDRSPRWQATINGREVDVWDVWPECSGEPISDEDFRLLIATNRWADQYAPASPEANPHKSIHVTKLPPIF